MTTLNLQGMTVLVAEDDPDLRECLAESLAMRGAEVITAADGRRALELFTSHPVDVILSDYRMPGGDGMAFLKAVRAKGTAHPPFIFLSGYSDISLAEALQEGAQAFLDKPCDFNVVAARLLGCVKK